MTQGSSGKSRISAAATQTPCWLGFAIYRGAYCEYGLEQRKESSDAVTARAEAEVGPGKTPDGTVAADA